MSAWPNDASRAEVDSEDLAVVVADLLEGTGGPLTDHELTRARQRLAHEKQH